MNPFKKPWILTTFLSYTIMLLLLSTNMVFPQVTNLITNGDQEIAEPFFFSKFNEGDGSSESTWAKDAAHTFSRSLKIVKPNASSAAVGWVSRNNADAWFHNMNTSDNFTATVSAWFKTEGVNTNPANDDERIGVRFRYYQGGTLQIEE